MVTSSTRNRGLACNRCEPRDGTKLAIAACALEGFDDAASRVTTSDELRTAAGQTNAGAITAVAPNYGQIPAFKLPFQCGEQWRLSTHGGLISGHRNVETEADFFRV